MATNLFSETADDLLVDFPTAYQLILDRIDRVNPLQYSRSRNFLNGAVTYLSPYISRGVITVKQVMDAVLLKGYQPVSIVKFLQELAWREYFQRVWQHKGNGIWQDIKQQQPFFLHRDMIGAIVEGKTGVNSIDEQVGRLYQSGYMHNHVRMYTASIVCNIAKAHWLQPSRWLYYYLLDGDIASNNCSWQWVAGAFSSSQYFCNQENINKYTGSNQQGTFLDKSYEEIRVMPLPQVLTNTIQLHLKTTLPATVFPNIDITKPTLIYNSYNLDPLWRNNEDVNRILLLEPSHFEQFPISDMVIQFILGLAANVQGIQVYVGELTDIVALYKQSPLQNDCIISKEHPAFSYYNGIKDERAWMFPQEKGYYNSFFSFWKKGEKYFV